MEGFIMVTRKFGPPPEPPTPEDYLRLIDNILSPPNDVPKHIILTQEESAEYKMLLLKLKSAEISFDIKYYQSKLDKLFEIGRNRYLKECGDGL
jgi:hypothetical protein